MKTYSLPKKLAAQAMREADSELYSKHLRGEFDDGDPNNPTYNGGFNYATGKYVSLFGYEQEEFMAKQHYRNIAARRAIVRAAASIGEQMK